MKGAFSYPILIALLLSLAAQSNAHLLVVTPEVGSSNPLEQWIPATVMHEQLHCTDIYADGSVQYRIEHRQNHQYNQIELKAYLDHDSPSFRANWADRYLPLLGRISFSKELAPGSVFALSIANLNEGQQDALYYALNRLDLLLIIEGTQLIDLRQTDLALEQLWIDDPTQVQLVTHFNPSTRVALLDFLDQLWRSQHGTKVRSLSTQYRNDLAHFVTDDRERLLSQQRLANQVAADIELEITHLHRQSPELFKRIKEVLAHPISHCNCAPSYYFSPQLQAATEEAYKPIKASYTPLLKRYHHLADPGQRLQIPLPELRWLVSWLSEQQQRWPELWQLEVTFGKQPGFFTLDRLLIEAQYHLGFMEQLAKGRPCADHYSIDWEPLHQRIRQLGKQLADFKFKDCEHLSSRLLHWSCMGQDTARHKRRGMALEMIEHQRQRKTITDNLIRATARRLESY